MRKHDYSKAADAVHQVKALLSEKVYKYEDEVTILTAIQQESKIQVEMLKSELYERWKGMIQWTVPSDKVKDSKEEPENLKMVLKINTKLDKTDILEKVVIGMKKMNILKDSMKKFVEMFYTHMVQPIVENRECVVASTESGASKVLTIEVTKTKTDDDEVTYPNPQDMFQNLDILLQFLNKHLLHVVIEDSSSDGQTYSLMNMMGSFIADDTLDLAVKQCLIKAIPSSHKDLEQFNTVIVATEEVQKRLVNMKFIQPDNRILMDYVQNVNTLFANKKCQEIIEQARILMTVEVHNTVRINHDKPLGELPALFDGEGGGGKKARKAELASESPISTDTFRLPSCLIR